MVNVAIRENHEDDYADSPPSMARSSLLRDLPTTERGLRTRAALIAAARKVFERMGYLDARLIDITRAAKCSAGTFYTYFSSKEEIFAAVLEVAQEDMLHPGMPHVTTEDDPAAIIEASNRAYLQAYQRNARLQASGQADPDLDPLLAARALSAMMSRFAFGHFVTREDRDDTPPTTDEDLVQIVTRLWVNALRIPRPGRRARQGH